jgi:broad specificity phosphatase PhoE
MKTYYIFRHALATYSTTGYGEGIVNAHILPEGVLPIQKMAEYLKHVITDYNVSSELTRCTETTAIINDIGGKLFVTDPRLNEFSLEENYSHESFEEFRGRLLSFLREVQEDVTLVNILICTHGAVIAGLKHILLNGTFTVEDHHDFPAPGQLFIIHGNGTTEIKDFNTQS